MILTPRGYLAISGDILVVTTRDWMLLWYSGRSQRCCQTSCKTQNSPTTMNFLAPKCQQCWGEKLSFQEHQEHRETWASGRILKADIQFPRRCKSCVYKRPDKQSLWGIKANTLLLSSKMFKMQALDLRNHYITSGSPWICSHPVLKFPFCVASPVRSPDTISKCASFLFLLFTVPMLTV